MFLFQFEACLCSLHSKAASIERKDNTDVKICIWIKTNVLRFWFIRCIPAIPYCQHEDNKSN